MAEFTRPGGVRADRVRDPGSVIEYRCGIDGVPAVALEGFFVGWPVKPTPDRHLAALRGSYRVVVPLDGEQVAGFVNAISDGVATAFIPWLEVRPDHRSRGIGRELVRRMRDELDDLYSVDLTCDPELVPYYRALGWAELSGMGLRRSAALIDPSPTG